MDFQDPDVCKKQIGHLELTQKQKVKISSILYSDCNEAKLSLNQ